MVILNDRDVDMFTEFLRNLVLYLLSFLTGGSEAPTADLAIVSEPTPSDRRILLDASASSDPDSRRLTYYWTITDKPTGSSAKLPQHTQSPTIAFFTDLPGQYNVSLAVSDGVHESPPVSAYVDVAPQQLNYAPVANVNAPLTAPPLFPIMLDGGFSNDQDHDLLSYHWSLTSAPAGSTASLAASTSVSYTSFTPDIIGT